jgi:hypothetical protein
LHRRDETRFTALKVNELQETARALACSGVRRF